MYYMYIAIVGGPLHFRVAFLFFRFFQRVCVPCPALCGRRFLCPVFDRRFVYFSRCFVSPPAAADAVNLFWGFFRGYFGFVPTTGVGFYCPSFFPPPPLSIPQRFSRDFSDSIALLHKSIQAARFTSAYYFILYTDIYIYIYIRMCFSNYNTNISD